MKKRFLCLSFAVLFLALPSFVFAETIAEWSLTADGSPSNIDSNVDAGDFIGGSAISSIIYSSATGARASKWISTALDGSNYFEITLSPKAGSKMNITDINFWERRSFTGIRYYEVQWSNNSSFAEATTIATIDLADNESERDGSITGLNISVGEEETIYIRFWGYNAEDDSGTWRINDGTLNIQGIVTEAIPPVFTIKSQSFSPTDKTKLILGYEASEDVTLEYSEPCEGTLSYFNKTDSARSLKPFDEDGTYSCTVTATDLAGNIGTPQHIGPFTVDTKAPQLELVTVVKTPTNNTTPSVEIYSDEDVKLSYSGGCLGDKDEMDEGDIEITFDALGEGTYSTCKITATDLAGNVGDEILVPSFTIDTTPPAIASTILRSNGASSGTTYYAKNGELFTWSVVFSEGVKLISNAGTTSGIGTLDSDIDLSSFGDTDEIKFQVDSESQDVPSPTVNFTIVDEAGNTTPITSLGNITNTGIADTTAPKLSGIVVKSTNTAINYAKTNDTIYVCFNEDDTNGNPLTFTSATIAGNAVIPTQTLTGCGAGFSWEMSLMTTLSNIAEGAVSYAIEFEDKAGNPGTVGATSSVIYDETQPIIDMVSISAISQDGKAYMGDAPKYYARVGDDIIVAFKISDLVSGIDTTKKIMGTVGGNNNVEFSYESGVWQAVVTTEDTWTEGPVGMSVNIFDNAGNNDGEGETKIIITGTTDGSSVVFDNTDPANAGDVEDMDGFHSDFLKALNLASFSWSGNEDAWKYSLQISNSAKTYPATEFRENMTYDARELGLLPTSSLDPYQLMMRTMDKAGNISDATVVYEQAYAGYLHGTVTNADGKVLPNTIVQVVARYGEFCDGNKEVCSVTTDAEGKYSLLINPGQNYNVTFFHNGYYLNKKDRAIAFSDFELDVALKGLTSIHDVQTNSQVVRLVLDGASFDIYTNSGQISTSQDGAITYVTSLSTITKIQQVAPTKGDFLTCLDLPVETGDLMITCNEENEWAFEGAGGVVSHNGGEIDYDANLNSRIGIAYNPANGKPAGFSGRVLGSGTPAGGFYSRADVRQSLAAHDAGTAPAIIMYKNANGYPVFAGYRAGRLAMAHYALPALNIVRVGGRVQVAAGESWADKLQEMKLLAGAIRPEKESFHVKVSRFGPLERRASGDGVQSVLARKRHQEKQVEKFARYNPLKNQRESKLAGKDYGSVAMTIGGKRVSMNQMFGLGDGSTLQLVRETGTMLANSSQ